MAQVGNGTLRVPLAYGYYYTVTGGPFRSCPKNYIGVKMAAEIPWHIQGKHHIDIPTQDFSVPDRTTLYLGLERAVAAVVCGAPLYVGCMAGRGRTGLFMAVLVKAFGVKNPVEYVRANYYRHAVETDGQYNFVAGFPILPSVRKLIKQARVGKWTGPVWDGYANLTRIPEPPPVEPPVVSDPNTPEALGVRYGVLGVSIWT